MNTHFYRIWLPVSLVAHLLLLVALNVFSLAVPPIAGESMIPISIVEAAEPPKPVPPPEETPVPPEQPATDDMAPTPRVSEHDTRDFGDPDARDLPGAVRGVKEGTKTGKHLAADTSGNGDGPTAPPSVLRTPTSRHFPAPPGMDGGVGTQGTRLGPSGPSYGARALSGPSAGTDKLAGEVNLDAVARFAVELDETGAVLSVRNLQSTGNDYLDGLAMMKIRQWQYKPAMKDGIPGKGSVRMKVEFHDGDYTIEAANK